MIPLYVIIGGGLGSFLRYFMIGRVTNLMGVAFPYGTLFVNIFGSFAMGVIIEYLTKTLPHSIELRAFLMVGVLGGFTTFSSFSLDAITLFDNGKAALALVYIISSVVLSILAVFVGMKVVASF